MEKRNIESNNEKLNELISQGKKYTKKLSIICAMSGIMFVVVYSTIATLRDEWR